MKKFLFLLLITICIFFDPNKTTLKVFLIEINPILNTITNKDLYKHNDGHPYVSEYFSQRFDRALDELKEDIKFASHGQLTVEIVQHSILNEFPKYTEKVKLLNEKSDYRYDETTYLSMSKSDDEKDKGDWFKLIYDPLFEQPENSFTFDYEYLIQKYDLVSKRNKNVFDHVWILGIDPLGTYETMMVGSGAFWINGSPIQKECPHFMITGFTISRRDANLHALAHSLEDIINYAYKGIFFTVEEDIFVDETQEAYEKLSYWEKFTLIDKLSKNQNAGVGFVHYPFNGASDYDYSNTKKVYSNWENWLNYPNINGTKNKYNNDAWMTLAGNAQLLKNSEENQDPDRLYIRFWMYLFPHIDGYTEDGFLNNWWGYFTNLDYVTKIDTKQKNITGYIGKEIELNYDVYYQSGEIENVKYAKQDKNVQITGNCVKFSNNKLIGAQKAKCSVSIYRDGKNVTFSINIVDSTNIYFIKFLE